LSKSAEVGSYRIAHPRERTALVELFGEHDLSSTEKLAGTLNSLAAINDVLIIDLSQTEFMDSSVLEELVHAQRVATGHGGRFYISGSLQPIVRKALELSGLIDHFDVVESWESAGTTIA
jgi:anti-anti-sigma factor